MALPFWLKSQGIPFSAEVEELEHRHPRELRRSLRLPTYNTVSDLGLQMMRITEASIP